LQEIEIKIKVSDFDNIEEKIKKIKIKQITGWILEDNFVFDHKDQSFKKENKLFRLRKFGDKIILTLKTPAKNKEKFLKIRNEYEVVVSDFKQIKKIIKLLGFKKFFRYQKYRKIFKIDNNTICFDKTPIGNYIEIEGEKEFIFKTAKLLNKGKNDFILDTYLNLFRAKDKNGDMVFEKS